MKKILVLVAAALTALLPTSCRKSETEPAKSLPASVSIAEVAPAKRAVSFTLNPTNAVRVLYCCVLRGETPAESAWIAREAAAPVQLTVGELEAGTAYTLLARAENRKGVAGETVTHDFETLRLPSLVVGDITTTAEGAEVRSSCSGPASVPRPRTRRSSRRWRPPRR